MEPLLREIGDHVILERDLSHRPEGKAPLCIECGEPVCFIEEWGEEGEFLRACWDLCAACFACGDHCLCEE